MIISDQKYDISGHAITAQQQRPALPVPAPRKGRKVMLRNAFAMKLHPGCEKEYKKRHDEIWPELSAQLKKAGVSDYSIFLDETTLTLFAAQKLSDDNTADSLAQTEIVKKWWARMADIMETNPDNSPVCVPLQEVFHLD